VAVVHTKWASVRLSCISSKHYVIHRRLWFPSSLSFLFFFLFALCINLLCQLDVVHCHSEQCLVSFTHLLGRHDLRFSLTAVLELSKKESSLYAFKRAIYLLVLVKQVKHFFGTFLVVAGETLIYLIQQTKQNNSFTRGEVNKCMILCAFCCFVTYIWWILYALIAIYVVRFEISGEL